MDTPKFRENAVTAVVRDTLGLTVFMRTTKKNETGETVTDTVLEPIRLAFAQCSEAVRAEAMGYGLEVRLTRAAALEKDTKSGRSASAQDKHANIKRLADHYASGTDAWAMTSAGGGGLSADARALIEALCLAFELEPDVAEAHLREMSAAERDGLRVDAEIKPWLDEVYAKRAKAAGAVDTQGLIARLRKPMTPAAG